MKTLLTAVAIWMLLPGSALAADPVGGWSMTVCSSFDNCGLYPIGCFESNVRIRRRANGRLIFRNLLTGLSAPGVQVTAKRARFSKSAPSPVPGYIETMNIYIRRISQRSALIDFVLSQSDGINTGICAAGLSGSLAR